MSETLIVRLGETEQSSVHWMVWAEAEQDIIASGVLPTATALASLKERAGNRPIIALVPTGAVHLRTLSLPPRAGRKVLSALNYMVEEDVAGDPDSLFIALGRREADQQPVAMVEKQQLGQWLAWLEDAQLRCHKMLPDVLALPHNDTGWTLLQLGEQWLVRQDSWRGMQGEPSWLFTAIEHQARQLPEPLNLIPVGELTLPNLANTHVLARNFDHPLTELARGATQATMNLLQGEFRQREQGSGQWQKWRLAAALAGLAVLLNILDSGVQLWQKQQQLAAVEAEIIASYKGAFPNARRIVNVRAQLRQQLAKLQTGGGASMLALMNQLEPAFRQTQVRPQSLRFDAKRNELRIQAIAGNFDALERFRRVAEQQGLQVQQGTINNQDSQVIGSISIRS